MALTTPIGVAIARSRWRVVAAAALGVAAISLDLFFYEVLREYSVRWSVSLAVGALVVLAWALPLAALADFDRASLGLRWRPIQGWRYWIVAALIMGGVVLVAGGIAALLLPALGFGSVEMPQTPPDLFWFRLPRAVVKAPLLEEGIYRLVFCAAVVTALRPWPTIVVGGAVFAALHFLYGNPGPDNFIAGYLFGWSFLKSGTIVVPIALHALGNLAVSLMSLAAYFYAVGSI